MDINSYFKSAVVILMIFMTFGACKNGTESSTKTKVESEERVVEYTDKGEIVLYEAWSDDEVEWFNQTGIGQVKGKVSIQTNDGNIRSCEGLGIELLPFSKYAQERVSHIYDNPNFGTILLEEKAPPVFAPDVVQYHEHARKTTCNDAGEFEFSHLPVGDYYIFAFMIWEEMGADSTGKKLGGGMMKKIRLSEGEFQQIDMRNY